MLFHPFHCDAHAACATSDGAYSRVQIGRCQIGLFCFCDVFSLLACQLADLVGMGSLATLLNASSLFDQDGRGGVFITKVKLLSANAVITTGIGRPGSTP